MSEKMCECEVVHVEGPLRLLEWIDNFTYKSGKSIKLAVDDYIKNRNGGKDKVDTFYNLYCIGTFRLNNKSTYTLTWREDKLVPIKIKNRNKQYLYESNNWKYIDIEDYINKSIPVTISDILRWCNMKTLAGLEKEIAEILFGYIYDHKLHYEMDDQRFVIEHSNDIESIYKGYIIRPI